MVAAPIALAPLPVTAGLVAGGVVAPGGDLRHPMAGILVGGTMTVTALAGRRALDGLRARRGEVEAALSLGLIPRDAATGIARPTAAQALVPAMGQTRTVGLVTLPGAFVGVLLGVPSVAVAVVVELTCRGRIRPATAAA